MNRKQRRAKQHGNVQYVQPVIRKINTDEVLMKIFYIPMLVMRDKYGYGTKRLGIFIEHLVDQMKAVEGGYLSVADMRETILKETGVEINL